MKPNAVLVDVSIDQGGCFETSHATTHTDPTYEVDGVTHYCVANMPGAAPITSTLALTNATLPCSPLVNSRSKGSARSSRPGLPARPQHRSGRVTLTSRSRTTRAENSGPTGGARGLALAASWDPELAPGGTDEVFAPPLDGEVGG